MRKKTAPLSALQRLHNLSEALSEDAELERSENEGHGLLPRLGPTARFLGISAPDGSTVEALLKAGLANALDHDKVNQDQGNQDNNGGVIILPKGGIRRRSFAKKRGKNF